MDDFTLTRKRLLELSRRAEDGYYFTYSDFLGLSEQTILNSILHECHTKCTLFGGVENTERVIARFGDPREIGYEGEFPIKCILILPRDERFSERLTHRDYLGTLMGLGIERDTLGDIIIRDKCAYLFAKEDIAPYIRDNLTRVRHTDITAVITDTLPEGELYRTRDMRVQILSPRADAIIARVFSLSRDDALALFKRGLVYKNGALIDTPSKKISEGDIVSVRGFGRFIYSETHGLTRRGRIGITVKLYE